MASVPVDTSMQQDAELAGQFVNRLSLQERATWEPFRVLKAGMLFILASIAFLSAQSFAQGNPGARLASCGSYQSQIDSLRSQFPQAPLWDDAKIARARASLANLEKSRQSLIALSRRLSGSEQSASNAEAFDRTAEANVWRRNAMEIRDQIDHEKKKAKAWVADAGVSCAGCTYSAAIAKVRAAIDAAVAARVAAYQIQQQLLTYQSAKVSAGCPR